LASETAGLQAQEAPQRQAEANEATKQAEQASREPNKASELAKKAEEAGKALQRLADQMAGKEGNTERADRLAKRQAELAKESERVNKKPDQAVQAEIRRKQQQIQDEAKQVRGGDGAAQEKQWAIEALSRLPRSAQERLPEEQQKAAEAMKELADKLAGQQAK